MAADDVKPPPRLQASIVSRIKIMSGLNIAEKRIPQDGRIRIRMAGREVDLRVSGGTVLQLSVEGGEGSLRQGERRLVLERLSRLGVTVVDARPGAVTARLVSAYLDIKARDMI